MALPPIVAHSGFLHRLGEAFVRDGRHSSRPTDERVLDRLVRDHPDGARWFVASAAEATDPSLGELDEAAWVAAALLDAFGDDGPWQLMARRVKALGTFAIENFAVISLVCQCGSWIDAPERDAAKDYWLTSGRDSGWCDRCGDGERTPLRRGEGFLVEGRTLAFAVGSELEGLAFDFGPELICRDCFASAGGTPRRLARTDELPGHPARNHRDVAYMRFPPPEPEAGQIVKDVESGTLSLEQLLTWVQEQKARIGTKPPSPGRLARLIARLRGGERRRRVGLPEHGLAWIRYAEQLEAIAEEAIRMRKTDPARALLRARAVLILGRLFDDEIFKIDILSRLGDIFREENCPFEAAEVFDQLALGHRCLDESRARKAARSGSELTSDPMGVAAIRHRHFAALRSLIDALVADKRYDEALERSLELFARANQSRDREIVRESRTTRGKIYLELGDVERARDCFFAAGEFGDRIAAGDDRPGPSAARVSNDLNDALAVRRGGRFEEAIVILTRLLETERVRGAPASQAWIRSELGFTYAAVGNRAAAVRELNAAATLAEGLTPPSEALSQLAAHWRTTAQGLGVQGEPGSSVTTSPAPGGDVQAPLKIRANQAAVLCQRGNWAEAREILEDLLRQARHERDVEVEIGVRVNLGVAIAMQDEPEGDLDRGIEQLRKAIALADSTGSTSYRVQSRKALASLLFDRKRWPEAMTVIKEAMPVLDEILYHNEDTESRQQLVAQSIALFELSVNINLHANYAPLRLLLIAEHVRARNLSRWFRMEAAFGQVEDGPYRKESIEHDLARLRAIEVELEARQVVGDLDGKRMTELRKARDRTRDKLDHLAEKSGREVFDWKTYFHSETLESLSLQVESVLEPGVAIVSLFSTETGVCTHVLYRPGAEVVGESWLTPGGREDRRRAALGSARGRPPGESSTTARSWDRDLVAAPNSTGSAPGTDAFRSFLFSRIASRLRTARVRRLIVIPHQELALVPYWGLADSCDSLESLIVAPSFEVLRHCLARGRPEVGPTLIVGDLTRTLAHAPREVELVRDARSASTVVETVASYAEFRQLAPTCSLVHVAGHGNFDAENPYESGFPLAPEDGARGYFARYTPVSEFRPSPEPRPGSLRLLTVAACMSELRLDSCRLAVLSTCESGIPRQHAGGELLGLPNAFLLAGAKSVVASLWKVHDGATYLLMKAFYETWAGGTGSEPSPARALACARGRLRQTDRSEACAILGGDASIPDGEFPFRPPMYSDAFHCFGSW